MPLLTVTKGRFHLAGVWYEAGETFKATDRQFDCIEDAVGDGRPLRLASPGADVSDGANSPYRVEHPVPNSTWGVGRLKKHARGLNLDVAGLSTKDALLNLIRNPPEPERAEVDPDEPSMRWGFTRLKAYAHGLGRDVKGVRSKEDMLKLILSEPEGAPGKEIDSDGSVTLYPAGDPSEEWTDDQLQAYAKALGLTDEDMEGTSSRAEAVELLASYEPPENTSSEENPDADSEE